jgi:hypothetical protein
MSSYRCELDEPSLDRTVAPKRILLRHPPDEWLDMQGDSPLGVVRCFFVHYELDVLRPERAASEEKERKGAGW